MEPLSKEKETLPLFLAGIGGLALAGLETFPPFSILSYSDVSWFDVGLVGGVWLAGIITGVSCLYLGVRNELRNYLFRHDFAARAGEVLKELNALRDKALGLLKTIDDNRLDIADIRVRLADGLTGGEEAAYPLDEFVRDATNPLLTTSEGSAKMVVCARAKWRENERLVDKLDAIDKRMDETEGRMALVEEAGGNWLDKRIVRLERKNGEKAAAKLDLLQEHREKLRVLTQTRLDAGARLAERRADVLSKMPVR